MQAGRKQGRGAPVVQLSVWAHIGLDVGCHARPCQAAPFGMGLIARCVGAHDDGRVDQQLKHRSVWLAPQSQTGRRRQIAARAVARHSDALRRDTQLDRVLEQPGVGGQRVIVSGRETVLGRGPVVHRKHGAAGGIAQRPADPVMAVDAAHHPATAMQVDQGRQHLVGAGLRRPDFAHHDLRFAPHEPVVAAQ